jgi:hypothetical protein
MNMGRKRLLAILVALLGGVGSLTVGVERLRQLWAWNTVKPEMLNRLVGETVGLLLFGCALIVGCLVYGIGSIEK